MGKVKLPTNSLGAPLPMVPDVAAVARTKFTACATAQDVTLNTSATVFQAYANSGDVYVRYATGCTDTNFDEIIQSGAGMLLNIPTGCTAISFLAATSGALYALIQKNASTPI